MLSDIFIPFITILLAELGDKTQIAVLCLATKTKKYLQLLVGVILAFIIADGLAILLGSWLNKVIPWNYIKIGSGILFILFGILTLLKRNQEENKCELKQPFLSGFSIILLSEMGDKTQITSGLFATQFDPWLVFIGVICALALLSIAAVFAGTWISTKLDRKKISIIAGSIFILLGILSFIAW